MSHDLSHDSVQAMAVLQGKSRDAVIRELQRTVSDHSHALFLYCHSHSTTQNLDVNQAVNNLLSRDDDDGGDGEGSEGDPLVPAAFFPSGGKWRPLVCGGTCGSVGLVLTDELLSLLGSVGAVGGEDELEEGRPLRGEGGREEGAREELAGRLSRAVLDELGSEPILVPVSVTVSR